MFIKIIAHHKIFWTVFQISYVYPIVSFISLAISRLKLARQHFSTS